MPGVLNKCKEGIEMVISNIGRENRNSYTIAVD